MSRDRQQTEAKILNAAKVILREEGFAGLKVNRLAEVADVGKPLIYRYFGDMDQVAQALVEEVVADGLGREGYDPFMMDRPQAVMEALVYHGRALANDRLARDLLIWSLGAKNAPTGKNAAGQSSDHTPYDEDDPAAMFALLKAAIAFMVLARDHHDSFAGVSLKTPKDMARLEYAMSRIVNKMWE